MRILQLVPRLPYPPDDGGKLGILGITNGYLAAGAQVMMGGFDEAGNSGVFGRDVGPRLAGWFSETIGRRDHLMAAASAVITNRPFVRQKYWSPSFCEIALTSTETFRPNLVHVDHSHMASYGLAIKRQFPGITVILRAHNVEYVIWERMAESARGRIARLFYRRHAKAIREFERIAFSGVDVIVPVTDVDATRIKALVAHKCIYVMPAGCAVRSAMPGRSLAAAEPRLVFVGLLEWAANRDGVRWFVQSVWPTIRAQWPKATLQVIGRFGRSVSDLPAADGVEYAGFVADLDAALSSVDVAVVPLRIGGGMRIKILDFMSRGIPVISTGVGAEGIPDTWRGEPTFLRADNAIAFRSALESLLESPANRHRLAHAGLKLIEERYDWGSLVRGLLDCVRTVTVA